MNLATAPANGSEYAVNTTPPTAGRHGDHPVRPVVEEGGHLPVRRLDDLQFTPGTTQVVQVLTVTP